MLQRDPRSRPSAGEFQSSRYFDNILMSTIRYLDTIVEQTQLHKAQFFKGLPKILAQFPRKALLNKVREKLMMMMLHYSSLFLRSPPRCKKNSRIT